MKAVLIHGQVVPGRPVRCGTARWVAGTGGSGWSTSWRTRTSGSAAWHRRGFAPAVRRMPPGRSGRRACCFAPPTSTVATPAARPRPCSAAAARRPRRRWQCSRASGGPHLLGGGASADEVQARERALVGGSARAAKAADAQVLSGPPGRRRQRSARMPRPQRVLRAVVLQPHHRREARGGGEAGVAVDTEARWLTAGPARCAAGRCPRPAPPPPRPCAGRPARPRAAAGCPRRGGALGQGVRVVPAALAAEEEHPLRDPHQRVALGGGAHRLVRDRNADAGTVVVALGVQRRSASSVARTASCGCSPWEWPRCQAAGAARRTPWRCRSQPTPRNSGSAGDVDLRDDFEGVWVDGARAGRRSAPHGAPAPRRAQTRRGTGRAGCCGEGDERAALLGGRAAGTRRRTGSHRAATPPPRQSAANSGAQPGSSDHSGSGAPSSGSRARRARPRGAGAGRSRAAMPQVAACSKVSVGTAPGSAGGCGGLLQARGVRVQKPGVVDQRGWSSGVLLGRGDRRAADRRGRCEAAAAAARRSSRRRLEKCPPRGPRPA
ncbi:hypothetical protein SANTM175S_05511 [Streptomyces antimycoticus]